MSVYFARVKGYVKIGYSADPAHRMTSIASGSCVKPDDVSTSDPVDLLGWIPGDRATETAMHRKFGPLGVVGEWFWDDDSYEEFLWGHESGVLMHGLPGAVALLMQEFPNSTRAEVVAAYEADRATKFADPDSNLSQLAAIFGDTENFARDTNARFEADRAKERAMWRQMRSAA